MLIADIPDNENDRLWHLKQLNIIDTIEEQAYDDLTLLAAQICNTPIALISFLDENRQWFKSHHGLATRETPRDISLCSHAILNDDIFIVENTDQDDRFKDNPLVNSGPKFKFYAGAPLILEGNVRIGTICVLDTKTSKLNEAQKQALQALARQVVSLLMLRLKVKELKKLDDVKENFLSMVSHELRTPLTSLKGSLDIMSQLGDMPEKMSTMHDVASRNTNQLLVIVNDILDIASMEAGKFSVEMNRLNLTQLLKSAKQINQPYVDQCQCKLRFDIPSELDEVEVFGDQARLLQVLSNLITNSAKFSRKKDGLITLSLQAKGQRMRVSVIDNGQGIQDQFKEKIFNRLQQAETPKNQKPPGTGLGLQICKHIIKAHGGEIGFNSEPDKKTEFYFTLLLAGE